ncbi:MAG: hypothetical protein Q7S48_01910 [bacterium]|nr:hypothetical protein [bacterium]
MRYILAGILCLAMVACATTSAVKDAPFHSASSRQYLVVRAPASLLGQFSPSEFRILLHVKAWEDNANRFSQSSLTYCDLRGDHLECLADLHYPNAKFAITPLWLQPDPATLTPQERARLDATGNDPRQRAVFTYSHTHPRKLCGTVKVGILTNHQAWSGGNADPDTWIDVTAEKTEIGCFFKIPRAFITAKPPEKSSNHQLSP